MIRFKCRHCESSLQADADKMGKQVACPKCRKYLIVPTPPMATIVVTDPPSSSPAPIPKTVLAPPPQETVLRMKDILVPKKEEDFNFDMPQKHPQAKEYWRRYINCVSPGLLFIVFILAFLPWTEISCNGSVMATQNGYQVVLGEVSLSEEMEKYREENKSADVDKEDKNYYSVITGIAFFAIFLTMIISVFPSLYKNYISITLLVFILTLLTIQVLIGFPLENSLKEAKKEAAILSAIKVETTFWYWLCYFLIFASGVASIFELFYYSKEINSRGLIVSCVIAMFSAIILSVASENIRSIKLENINIENEDTTNKEKPSKKYPTIKQLYEERDINPILFDEKYKNKNVTIYGKVDKISYDDESKYALVLLRTESSDVFDRDGGVFELSLAEARKIRKGQYVAINGTYDGVNFGQFHFKSCLIVE